MLIAQFKFQEQPGWAAHFARMMRAAPGVAEAVEAADLVLAMPLSRERLAARGFNQALEIARRMAPRAKTPAELLLRLRDTPPQASLGRGERLANVRHAFGIDPQRGRLVRGRQVLLVDDVMTSGASLFTAAAVLRQAGAARVCAAVLARTGEAG
jgi:ComF family protein